MVRTTDTAAALEFCAQATRLGLGLEVTAEGRGVYALCTRDWDEGGALVAAAGGSSGRADHGRPAAVLD
jgi:hypothetical protein